MMTSATSSPNRTTSASQSCSNGLPCVPVCNRRSFFVRFCASPEADTMRASNVSSTVIVSPTSPPIAFDQSASVHSSSVGKPGCHRAQRSRLVSRSCSNRSITGIVAILLLLYVDFSHGILHHLRSVGLDDPRATVLYTDMHPVPQIMPGEIRAAAGKHQLHCCSFDT